RRAAATADAAGTIVIEAGSLTTSAAEIVAEAGAVSAAARGVVTDAGSISSAARDLVTEAGSVASRASAVVNRAGQAAEAATGLLDDYTPTLRKAAPLAARFVEELTPEEVTAAIRMVDELPVLRDHLVDDVMPLLNKLDQVGPDLHKLLEVTEDLHLAIAGLPGLRLLRRRGEERTEDHHIKT
ncbi:hypothetical protein ACFOZ6_18205, partial [Actinoplanes siamensis]